MSDPTRLKDLPGLESELLRSAQGEAMPERSRRALAMTLGLGPAVPAPLGAAAGTKALPAIAAKTGLGVAAKVMIAVTVAAGISAGGYLVVDRTSAEGPSVAHTIPAPVPPPDRAPGEPSIAPPAPALPAPEPPTPPTEIARPPARAAKASIPVPTVAPVEVTASRSALPPEQSSVVNADPRLAAQTGSGSAAAPVVHRSVTDEITLIDAARAALRHHDAVRALHVLDEYDRQFPTGTMTPEAAVARIEATVATGDQAGAQVLEAAFLAAHPDSPLAQRVRALMTDHPVAP